MSVNSTIYYFKDLDQGPRSFRSRREKMTDGAMTFWVIAVPRVTFTIYTWSGLSPTHSRGEVLIN